MDIRNRNKTPPSQCPTKLHRSRLRFRVIANLNVLSRLISVVFHFQENETKLNSIVSFRQCSKYKSDSPCVPTSIKGTSAEFL